MVKLRLKTILKQKGMSKYRFGKHLKMESVSHVYRLMKNGYDPKISTLRAWAFILRCKITDLIEDEDFSHLPPLEVPVKKRKAKRKKKRNGNNHRN